MPGSSARSIVLNFAGHIIVFSGVTHMNKIALPLVVAALGMAASAAHASDGTLTINGTITANTCTISGNGQGPNFAVTLPVVSATTLATKGSTAGATNFNIALTNCTGTGNVHTFWEYGANTLADGNLKNTADAANVEVQLLDYNGSMQVIDVSKGDGAQNTQSVAISSSGSATLKYAAQYYSAGTAGAGAVKTSVVYSMSYQ
jgi:major type 1 subunit fimbrin (pilin)